MAETSGFLGTKLAHRLTADGHEVRYGNTGDV